MPPESWNDLRKGLKKRRIDSVPGKCFYPFEKNIDSGLFFILFHGIYYVLNVLHENQGGAGCYF